MATEVIDVIHNLVIDANTSGIDPMISALDKTLSLIVDQTAEIKKLEAARAHADKANTAEIQRLNAALAQTRKEMAAEVALVEKRLQGNEKLTTALQRQIAVLGKLLAEAKKGGEGFKPLITGADKGSYALLNLGRVAQDLPFGFIGIQNNLPILFESFTQLVKETGSVSAAFSSLKASILGVAGLGFAVSILTSALTLYTLHAQGAKTETHDLAKEMKAANDEIEKLVDNLQNADKLPNIFGDNRHEALKKQLALLEATTGKESEAHAVRRQMAKEEIDDLNKQAQAYGKLAFVRVNNLSPQEQFDAIKQALPDANKSTVEGIITQLNKGAQISSLALEKQAELSQKARDKQAESEVENIKFQQESAERQKTASDEAYSAALKHVDDEATLSTLNDKVLTLVRARIQSAYEIQQLLSKSRAEQGINVSPIQAAGEADALKKQVDELETFLKARTLTITTATNLQKVRVAQTFNRPIDAADFQIKANEADLELSSLNVNVRNPMNGINIDLNENQRAELNKKMQATRRSKDEIKELLLPDKDKTAEHLKTVETIYHTFTDSIITLINTIHDAQIRALDDEISIRENRVAQATELAKRGDSEVLRSETERLQAAERARRKSANQQLEINGVLAASNSALAATEAIGAVVKAAAEGDPYTIALRVAAAVAAIVAGIAAIKGAFTKTNSGFWTGGYTGDGARFEVAGPVHKGEFVFDQQKTAQHRELFEAIHAGRTPYTASMPVESNRDEAASLRKELIDVRHAIENIYFHGENKLDGHGLHQIYTTNLKQVRRMYHRP